jgi:hypothetical protein
MELLIVIYQRHPVDRIWSHERSPSIGQRKYEGASFKLGDYPLKCDGFDTPTRRSLGCLGNF